jgi:hypothetical protein
MRTQAEEREEEGRRRKAAPFPIGNTFTLSIFLLCIFLLSIFLL